MPAHKKSRRHRVRHAKKKSLISFLIVLVISLAIGIPLALKLNQNDSSQAVKGVSSSQAELAQAQGQGSDFRPPQFPCPTGAPCPSPKFDGNGENRGGRMPNPSVAPKADLKTLTFYSGDCAPYIMMGSGALFIGSASYTCSDGTSGNVTPSGNARCANVIDITNRAARLCAGFPQPSAFPTEMPPKGFPPSGIQPTGPEPRENLPTVMPSEMQKPPRIYEQQGTSTPTVSSKPWWWPF